MPQVILIHELTDKPPNDRLLVDRAVALVKSGLDLTAKGVRTSMVYSANVLTIESEDPNENLESISQRSTSVHSDDNLRWIKSLPKFKRPLSRLFTC